ncbi:hypothetical protein [Methylocystis echinoides]|nr:hypothetical protein [Methylocystis echinoides]
MYRIVSIAALYAKREEGSGPWTVVLHFFSTERVMANEPFPI